MIRLFLSGLLLLSFQSKANWLEEDSLSKLNTFVDKLFQHQDYFNVNIQKAKHTGTLEFVSGDVEGLGEFAELFSATWNINIQDSFTFQGNLNTNVKTILKKVDPDLTEEDIQEYLQTVIEAAETIAPKITALAEKDELHNISVQWENTDNSLKLFLRGTPTDKNTITVIGETEVTLELNKATFDLSGSFLFTVLNNNDHTEKFKNLFDKIVNDILNDREPQEDDGKALFVELKWGADHTQNEYKEYINTIVDSLLN